MIYLQVVGGDVSGRGGPPPPLQDRYTALALLMELDIQKVELWAGNLWINHNGMN